MKIKGNFTEEKFLHWLKGFRRKYPYTEETGSFKKETYISKIAIYDEDKNLIGIAKVATPVRKRENDQFTFKLILDY